MSTNATLTVNEYVIRRLESIVYDSIYKSELMSVLVYLFVEYALMVDKVDANTAV